MAFGTAARAAEKCFAARGIAGEQKFERVVFGPARASEVRLLEAHVQESDYIGYLSVIERDWRHALGRPAIANHRADEIAVFVVPDKHRAHQVGTFGAAVRIRAMTKSAGLRKLRLAAFCRLLTQGDTGGNTKGNKARQGSQHAGETEARIHRVRTRRYSTK